MDILGKLSYFIVKMVDIYVFIRTASLGDSNENTRHTIFEYKIGKKTKKKKKNKKKTVPKLNPFASWPGAMINA